MRVYLLLVLGFVFASAYAEPVTFAGKTLFHIKAASGGKTAAERVAEVEARLVDVLGETKIMDKDVRIEKVGGSRAIYVKKHLFVTCTPEDAAQVKASIDKAAKDWRSLIAKNIVDMHLLPSQVGSKTPSGEKR